MKAESEERGWEAWWDARVAAMEDLFGPCDEFVGHATIPFEMGAAVGGAADVILFKRYLPGVIAVTSDLIGNNDQELNSLGNYELAICTRAEEPWAAVLISRLAYYTLEAKLEPGQTMDIAPALPEGSSIAAFLFVEFGRFKVLDRDAGVLLCFGITAEELQACRDGRRAEVENGLRHAGLFPFTELRRSSVNLGKKDGGNDR
jgi:hypothetical protein